MEEFLNSLTLLGRFLFFFIVAMVVAGVILQILNARLSRKVKRMREDLEILKQRSEDARWPTNEQLRILTKHVEESGNPDDKKLLSVMMKIREYSVGDGFDKIPEGLRREIEEAEEILKKANPE